MDVSQYLEIFIDETKEHLQSLNEQLLILENEPENEDTINEIFRAAHSLKGMAGTMGYKRMQRLTHDMENVFSEVRNGKMKITGNLIDVLFLSLDALEGYLECIQETADEGTNDNEPIINELNQILEGGVGGGGETPKAKEEEKKEEENTAEKKWLSISLNENQKHAIEVAREKGCQIFGMTIHIQETCILKAARAFLVFQAIEAKGEIIASVPTIQEVEDERFEFDFSLICSSTDNFDNVMKEVRNVSEIESALGEVIEPVKEEPVEEKPSSQSEEKPAAKTEDTKPQTVKAPTPAPQQKKPSGAQQKQAKPIVNRTVRVDIEKLDVLMNLVSELIIAKNSLVAASDSNRTANATVNENIEYLESVTTNLHESVMKVRMVPIESVVNKFPRMIRDLTKTLNKKMELFMSGEETELDRTVVDEIGDPLMHLLRNSADHGLESNDVRIQRGKPEVGSIFLDAYQDGNNVIIEVRDDGNGIDIEKIKEKALERGTVSPEQADMLTDKEILDMLFLPSFSTAKQVTDVSGRGVGLDVVKSKIEALGGDVQVKTKLGEGSTFTIRLPLTLAIIQALMVVIGNEKYAIALGSIETIEDITDQDVKLVGAKEVINLRGNVIPLIRLNEILDIESSRVEGSNLIVIIVKKGDSLAGVVVDELMGQQEIVIKSLGKYINSDRMISGATILGDGEVALILDANALF